jgi:hypothetical protein
LCRELLLTTKWIIILFLNFDASWTYSQLCFRCLQFLFRRYSLRFSHLSMYRSLIGKFMFSVCVDIFEVISCQYNLWMHSCLLLQPSPSSRALHIQQWGICEVWVGWIRTMVLPSNRRGTISVLWPVKGCILTLF